jgi:hypothetical protein
MCTCIKSRYASIGVSHWNLEIVMRATPMTTSLACAALVLSSVAFSQEPAPIAAQQAVYPAKGQTGSQQKIDQDECYTWAVQQSGYDPAHPPAMATAQTAPVTGSGTRARGAAAGAAVGAIGGNDVGNAAVKGAVVGGVVQRNRNRAAASQANQASAQQQQAGLASYQNARRACLEGRGYNVK